MAEQAAAEKPTKTGASSGAESPTTARELDFDDDNDTSAAVAETVTSPPPPSKSPKPGVRFSEDATEIPPPKPPRPMSPQQQAKNTLIEAFPDIDPTIITTVLRASKGDMEAAFDALLGMSDPNYKPEPAPPPQPPRPQRNQVDTDGELARRMFEEDRRLFGEPNAGNNARDRPQPQRERRKEAGSNPNQPHEERNLIDTFMDDEFPAIRKEVEDMARKTTNKLTNLWNSGMSTLQKTFDGEPEEYDRDGNPVPPSARRQDFGSSRSDQVYGIRKSAEQRRSADHNRYDTDNRVLGDDFEALELRDDEAPPPKPNRPLANPDLFKPTPMAPPQSGPVDEVDALYRNPSPNNQSSNNTGKTGGKKWQPLTSVAPHPEPDDHDPFSLGDSDEEEMKTKDINAEATERLKKAAEAKEAPVGGQLQEARRSGSVGQRDAAAEALLKESK